MANNMNKLMQPKSIPKIVTFKCVMGFGETLVLLYKKLCGCKMSIAMNSILDYLNPDLAM